MLKSIKDINGFRISAFDGKMGKVYGFLFDEESHFVKFAVIETGIFFNSRLVLLEPDVLGKPDMAERELPVYLTKDEIINSPSAYVIISELKKNEGYAWPYYWVGTGAGFPGVTPTSSYGLTPFGLTPVRGRLRSSGQTVVSDDPALLSTRQITGYKVKCRNENAGNLEDILLDDESWKLPFIIVNTSSRLKSGRRVLAAMRWVMDIDLEKENILLSIPAAEVKFLPEYDPVKVVRKDKRENIERLYDHFYKMIPGLILNSRK